MEGSIRICLLTLVPDFQGYGFNLHAEKNKAGQFIGKVDEGSPADRAGLKEGDRIVEVNGLNIDKDNHKDVVDKIKSGGKSVSLLVCDQEADLYCQKNGITIINSLECVQDLSADVKASEKPEVELKDSTETNGGCEPENNEAVETNTGEVDDLEDDLPPPPPEVEDSDINLPPPPTENELESQSEEPQTNGGAEREENSESEDEPTAPEAEPTAPEAEPEVEEPKPTPIREPDPEPVPEPPAEPTPSQPVKAQATVNVETPAEPPQSRVNDPLPKVSAKEMKEILKNRKKSDPRKSGQSAKDKLSMFQRL